MMPAKRPPFPPAKKGAPPMPGKKKPGKGKC